MAKEQQQIQVVLNILANGRMVENMEEQHMCGKVEKKKMESGIMIRCNIGWMKYHLSNI